MADADAQIQEILGRATELADSLPPLYTWDELCDTIASEDLAALNRHPVLEKLYVTEFNPLIRRAYGSTEAYLRLRLGWAAPAPDEEGGQREDQEGRQPAGTSGQRWKKEYWERDDTVNVRRNDWKYSMPREVSHYVVWVDLPLFHPLLCSPPPSSLPSHLASTLSSSTSAPASGASTPSGPSRHNPFASRADGEPGAALIAPTKGTWDHVSEKGLGGLTGAAQRRWRRRRGLPEDGEQDGASRGEAAGPEREVRAFVERKWPEKDGWETAWFANPPALQSVPGLAHFHVLARQAPQEDQDAGHLSRGTA
ncbi:hypothetical protein JCM9279_002729 [Rhodotorula babjevae]